MGTKFRNPVTGRFESEEESKQREVEKEQMECSIFDEEASEESFCEQSRGEQFCIVSATVCIVLFVIAVLYCFITYNK